MSLSDIRAPYVQRSKKNQKWKGDVSQNVIKKIFPPLTDLLRIKKTPEGIPLRNLSDARIKIILIVSGMSGGKSKLVDYIIKKGNDEYGEDLINVRVSRDLFSLVGTFDKETQEFYGGSVSNKPINIFVHDDALSQLGRNAKKGVIDTFDAIFNNTRHLVRYQDEYGNKKGLVVIILNMQDLHTLHVDARKNWTMVIYKTLVKNDQNFVQFKARIPSQGLKILQNNTQLLDDETPDEDWKNINVVDFGFGNWGKFVSKLVVDSWCYDGSPFWAGMLQDRNIIKEETQPIIRETTSGKYTFIQIKEEVIDISNLKDAWDYGKKHPYPTANRAKYKENPHWYATYAYFIEEKAADIICEGLGLKGDTMLTNGYNKGGYVAIVIREQLGHWIEPIIPQLIPDIKWYVITGQGKTDLKDEDAIKSKQLGIGLHGEIKTRRKKETPNEEWLSTEMGQHMKLGGKGLLYQLIIRRVREVTVPTLITYEVKYSDDDKLVPYRPKASDFGNIDEAQILAENGNPSNKIEDMLKQVDVKDISDIFA